MLIEAIDDIDSTELYIKELEEEITSLQLVIKKLKKQLVQPKDTISKDKYLKVCATLQEFYNEEIPF